MKKYLHKTIVILIIAILMLIFGVNNVYADVPSYAERLEIHWNENWKYANESKIHTGIAYLYKNTSNDANNITVCVNAGHGTAGGELLKNYTYSHPDHTPKITDGTNAAGEILSIGVSSGMTFYNRQSEASVTLKQAIVLRDLLLRNGYNVLMIRESDDVQLDNVARTVIANNNADCHVSIHWDGDDLDYDKGAYFMSVTTDTSYRNMEPVKSNYKKHDELGRNLIDGLMGAGIHIWNNGELESDLTQTSYSTIPSVDIELGNAASDTSGPTLDKNALGLANGINNYFKKITNRPAHSVFENIRDAIAQTFTGAVNKVRKLVSGQALVDKIMEKVNKVLMSIADGALYILDACQWVLDFFQTGTLGTLKDVKILYSTDKILANENINRFIDVKVGETNSDAKNIIDGEEEGFDSDTTIPFIPVDMYNIMANQVADFDINFFTGQNDTVRHSNKTIWLALRRFIATLIRIEIVIASAILVISLIWHGINIVAFSLNPKSKKEHKDGLKNFSIALALLIGSIIFMLMFIFLAENITKSILPNENTTQMPITVSVSKANYWFKTNPTGYIRYMAQISKNDMVITKFGYILLYAIFILLNYFLIRYVMIPRTIAMIFLCLLAPIIAVAYAFGQKKILGFTYTSWMINYVKIASIQLFFAAMLKILITFAF